MADGLISVNRERKIVTLNRKAAEFFGAKEEDLKSKEISKVLGKILIICLRTKEGCSATGS